MSGHSKWSQIKHKKSLTDVKKGKVFSKIARIISLAAKEGGTDPAANAKLRLSIEQAHSVNMPNDNIEKAIKRGGGELDGEKIEPVIYEAYGPGGVALILEGITDNKNRTAAEIKHLLDRENSKLAEAGSVLWMFDKKGAIEIDFSAASSKTKEDLELAVIDSGADDFHWREEEILEIYVQPNNLEKVKKNLENRGLAANSSSLDWVAKNPIKVADPRLKIQLEKLFNALDENEDISEIYSNLDE